MGKKKQTRKAKFQVGDEVLCLAFGGKLATVLAVAQIKANVIYDIRFHQPFRYSGPLKETASVYEYLLTHSGIEVIDG